MKDALVIGGSGDIGSAVIDELKKDYNINFTYCKNQKRSDEIEGKAYQFDFSRNTKNVLNSFISKIDNLDVLVTAAFPFMMADAFKLEGYEKIEPYLRSYLTINTLAAQKMKENGKLINIIGSSANFGSGKAPYSAACYAFIDNWAKGANATYGKKGGVQVCNLLLGPVETKRWGGLSEELRAKYNSDIREFLQPADVAKYVRNIIDSSIVPTSIVIDSFNSLK
jgi:NAD(P)-dependent dehydrogenase (short-subunit alcohol dehydrogenase family)